MKTSLFTIASILALSALQPAFSQEASRYCYKILVDGKDRSAFQYVNSHLITFADPSWKQDPTVDEVKLVDLKTGNVEPSPQVQHANYMPTRAWGGVTFGHIPFGQELTLRIGTTHVTFQRVEFGKSCPHSDFRLDDRQNGYEVLQYCPYDLYMGPLGSRLHVEGEQVILKTSLLFTACTATILRAGEDTSEPFAIRWVGGSRLSELFPNLAKQIWRDWGLLSAYFIFPVLNPGDELKVTVTLPGEDQQVSFLVRKID